MALDDAQLKEFLKNKYASAKSSFSHNFKGNETESRI